MCQVTKYYTNLGVFQQLWPGERGQGFLQSAILNEEKALGTNLLDIPSYIYFFMGRVGDVTLSVD